VNIRISEKLCQLLMTDLPRGREPKDGWHRQHPYLSSTGERGRNSSGAVVHTSLMSRDERAGLLKIVEGYGAPYAHAARHIKNCLELIDNPLTTVDKQKARDVHHAAALVTVLVYKTPGHRVYQQEAHDADAYLGYYVDHIGVTDIGERDEPREATFISMRYVINGKTCTRVHKLEHADVIGRTAADILASVGLYPEVRGFKAFYDADMKKFVDVYPRVGTQYVARGVGYDHLDNAATNDDGRRWWRGGDVDLDRRAGSTHVVIDIPKEAKTTGRESRLNEVFVKQAPTHFWEHYIEEMEREDTGCNGDGNYVPWHPYVPCFDLDFHTRYNVHVANLTLYKYNTDIINQLVLPRDHKRLVKILVESKPGFTDFVRNKAGGTVIVCHGPAGLGKTLSAETFSEMSERPLYRVQCSQLGLDPEAVEKNLAIVCERANRWNAVVLMDEADVYIAERQRDLTQNAIVGVFLRLLEYVTTTIFMTTNRGDIIDDAILSRCTAKLEFMVPPKEQQARIWVAIAGANNAVVPDAAIQEIQTRIGDLSGRDIKMLIKLAIPHCQKDAAGKTVIDADTVFHLSRFKPSQTTGTVCLDVYE